MFAYCLLAELTRFIHKLDKRQEIRQGPSGGFKGLERRMGEPSQHQPPLKAPSWTIDRNFHSDMRHSHTQLSTPSPGTTPSPGQPSSLLDAETTPCRSRHSQVPTTPRECLFGMEKTSQRRSEQRSDTTSILQELDLAEPDDSDFDFTDD